MEFNQIYSDPQLARMHSPPCLKHEHVREIHRSAGMRLWYNSWAILGLAYYYFFGGNLGLRFMQNHVPGQPFLATRHLKDKCLDA